MWNLCGSDAPDGAAALTDSPVFAAMGRLQSNRLRLYAYFLQHYAISYIKKIQARRANPMQAREY
jgi:hypothetical protein